MVAERLEKEKQQEEKDQREDPEVPWQQARGGLRSKLRFQLRISVAR